MIIKLNGVNIAAIPADFSIDVMDLDDGATTTRTVDGTLHRDRIGVKRKLNMRWNALTWSVLSQLLQSVKDEFFEVYYPDPETGQYETKTFYVGDRQSPVAASLNGEIVWTGLTMNFIER